MRTYWEDYIEDEEVEDRPPTGPHADFRVERMNGGVTVRRHAAGKTIGGHFMNLIDLKNVSASLPVTTLLSPVTTNW